MNFLASGFHVGFPAADTSFLEVATVTTAIMLRMQYSGGLVQTLCKSA